MNRIDPRLYFLMRKLGNVRKKYFSGAKIRVLDVGCADGSFINIVKENLREVLSIEGVDVASKWTLGKRDQKSAIRYLQDLQLGTGEIPLASYHIITAWEVIEHIENIPVFLRNARKLMTDGGVLLLSTPNLFGLSRFIKGRKWVGVAEEDHKYLFDRLSLRMILERNGFSDINIKGYFFPSAGPSCFGANEIMSRFPGGGMLFCQTTSRTDIILVKR